MSKTEYLLSQVVNNEYKDFATYTVESRAIPNMADGLKPVQRFYLYSSLKNSKTDFKKVSAVAGVISDYGYNHGEASASQAGQLMAADWGNHICLVKGRGNFGSRLVPEAAAPRYTYSMVSENFFAHFPDIDLCPVHKDVEHEPPAYYLPILPMVLVNGAEGIATGFAVNILPRHPKVIHKAVEDVLAGKKLKKNSIKPSFPKCLNTFEFDATTGSWIERAPFERPSQTKVIINDVLYGTSREKYIEKVLDALESEDQIVGWEDMCSDSFKFEVTLKRGIKYTDAQIIKMLKLQTSHRENINVIDGEGKLKENYTCAEEIIEDFVKQRFSFLIKRIEKNQAIYTEKERYASVVIQYIEGVLAEKIKFAKGKKTDAVTKEILKATNATPEDCEKLLRMSMFSLTDEKVKDLKEQLKTIQGELKFWLKTTQEDQYKSDLATLKNFI